MGAQARAQAQAMDVQPAVTGPSETALASQSAAQSTIDLMSLPIEERVRYSITDLVVQTVGSAVQIENDTSMMETGMTSITSIMLRDKISAEFPELEDLDLTFVFEYPSIRLMSEYILDGLTNDD